MISDRMIAGLRDSDLIALCHELRISAESRILDPWDCPVRVAEDYAKVLEAMYIRCPYALDRVQKEQVQLAGRMEHLVSVSYELSAGERSVTASADLSAGRCGYRKDREDSGDCALDDGDTDAFRRRLLMLHPEIMSARHGPSDIECGIPFGRCTFRFSDGSTLCVPSDKLNSWFADGLMDLTSAYCRDLEVPVPDHRHGIICPEWILLLDIDEFERMYRRTEKKLYDAIYADDEGLLEKHAFQMCVMRREANDRMILLDEKEKAGISLRGDYEYLRSVSYEIEGMTVTADLLRMTVSCDGKTCRFDADTRDCIIEQLTHCYLNLHTSETTDDSGIITMTYLDGTVQTVDQRDLMDPLGAVYPLFYGLRSL